MKKILMTIMAMTMLVATSCKKENINEPNNIVPGEGEFVVTIANAPRQNAPALSDDMTTKTTIHGSDIHWKAFDEISINGVKYQTDMSGSPTVLFKSNEGSAPQIDGYYKAYYPAGIDPTNNGGISTLPDAVLYDGGDIKNLPMYAVSTNKYLTFHNICAAIKITVPVTCNKIVISADENLAGRFTFDGDGDETPYWARLSTNQDDAEYMSKTITITGTFAASTTEEPVFVYVAISEGKYTNFAIQFFNGQTPVMRRALPNDLNLKVNNLYNLTFGEIPADAFCFTANGSCTLTFEGSSMLQYYTFGMTDWGDYTANTDIQLSDEQKVYFRAKQGGNNSLSFKSFSAEGEGTELTVSGNIMYLLDPTGNMTNLTPTTNDNAFKFLFNGMTQLVDASGLILPAKTLAANCYNQMFNNCSSLIAAPALPAMTLASYCYQNMFASCKSLTVAPNLHATVLANNCCQNMFNGCSSLGVKLVTEDHPAPSDASTLIVPSDISSYTNCVSYMFSTQGGVQTLEAGNTYYFYDATQH